MAQMIGITGTHSTGKSTFFEKVREQAERRGLHVARVGDVATRCQAAGFPILRDHTFESTLWIIASVISSELEHELKCDLILVDRPASDAIGYLEAALVSTRRTITAAERNYLYTLVGLHSSRYAMLFKTELDKTIPLGDGRDPDQAFRAAADEHIARSLKELGIPTHNPEAPESQRLVEDFLDKISRSAIKRVNA
ncbi:ATP-binding protein [Burkholderia pyrrocinia]|uniref:AAA family ATPase n=1 Tax=Burkholderia pyrrocinia TaxID=60550 RepID=UPI001FB2542B|nr:AAA family ATPase [Burkholderia pyrrocinia]UOB59689.1 ATP-binding protein [Burkholderia pyrrocinia]